MIITVFYIQLEPAVSPGSGKIISCVANGLKMASSLSAHMWMTPLESPKASPWQDGLTSMAHASTSSELVLRRWATILDGVTSPRRSSSWNSPVWDMTSRVASNAGTLRMRNGCSIVTSYGETGRRKRRSYTFSCGSTQS